MIDLDLLPTAAPNGKPLARTSGPRSRRLRNTESLNAADKGERRKQRDQWAAKTLRDLRIAEIAQLVGAILDGKAEAYPARVATARFFATHLANAAPGLTTSVIETSVAVDVERIG